MMKYCICRLFGTITLCLYLNIVVAQVYNNISQPVVIGTSDDEDGGPIVQLYGGGLSIPMMDSIDVHAIVDPGDGLMVLDTTNFCLFIFHNGLWRQDCSFLPIPDSITSGVPEANYIPIHEANGNQRWQDPNEYTHTFHRVLFNATSREPTLINSLNFIEDLDPSDSFDSVSFTAPVSGTYFFSTHISFDRETSTPPDDANKLSINIYNTCGVDAASIKIAPEEYTSTGREMASSLSTVVDLTAGCRVRVGFSGNTITDVRALHRVFSGYLLTKE